MTRKRSPPKLGNLSIDVIHSRRLPIIVREESDFVVGMKETSC
jgi:hypothetical protein